jgi:UDP-N-acetyl-D-mannosaminuronic acid transferase (WecB/TagA/CpsF family)
VEKIPLTKRALKMRLKRHMSRNNEMLRFVGGRYVVVNTVKAGITDEVPDLEQFARDRGYLQPYEALTD